MPSSNFMPVDEYGNRPTATAPHVKIHQGLHWTAVAYQTGASAMNVIITAPSDIHYHFIALIQFNVAGSILWTKTPGVTLTAASTIISYNNNEDSPNASTLVIQSGATYVSSGTILDRFIVGSATGPGTNMIVGGDAAHDEEWELGYSSVHLIRVVPVASCETAITSTYYRKE